MADEQRVALVTGASRGIGRCAAVALARRGFDVVITARTVREGDGRAHASSVLVDSDPMPIAGSLESTAADIEALGRRCLMVPMDLMDRSSVEHVAVRALEELGRVDVLVNNAIYQGPGTMDRILDLPLELAAALPGGRLPAPAAAHSTPAAPDARARRRAPGQHAVRGGLHHPTEPGRPRRVGRRLRRRQGRLPPGDRHVPRRVRRCGHQCLLHRAGTHPDRVDAGLGHGCRPDRSRSRSRPARGGGRGGRLARRRSRRRAVLGPDGLVTPALQGARTGPGWPPPRRARPLRSTGRAGAVPSGWETGGRPTPRRRRRRTPARRADPRVRRR